MKFNEHNQDLENTKKELKTVAQLFDREVTLHNTSGDTLHTTITRFDKKFIGETTN